MNKFGKYADAQAFAKVASEQEPGRAYLVLQTGATEFLVVDEAAYQHSIICARYVAGNSVGRKA